MSEQIIEIDAEVEDASWTDALPDAIGIVERAAVAALRNLPLSDVATRERGADHIVTGSMADQVWHMPTVRIAIALMDDETVAGLNAQFRGKAGPTNVLSFDAGFNMEGILGDIALAYGVCAREAVDQDKTLADHLSHLTVHGVLHLAGYDHQTDDEAEAMEDLERRVLATLGVSDPYAAERT